MAQLKTPRLTVVLADPGADPDVDDGTEYTVQARNIDLCMFDRDRAKLGYPKADDGPFMWMTYVAWRALQRTGRIDACPLGEFEKRCLSVTSDTDGPPVDPTQPAATAG